MSHYEIISFYKEKNDKTGKYHWQHMATERMIAICRKIASSSHRAEDRKAAASLVAEILNFKAKK